MTTIYGTSKYVDLVAAGKKLFLSPGIFGNIDITLKIVRIDSHCIGSRTNMKSAVFRGFIGTAIAGLPGTLLGVATAREEPITVFRIEFEATFELHEIFVVTTNYYLERWLHDHQTEG